MHISRHIAATSGRKRLAVSILLCNGDFSTLTQHVLLEMELTGTVYKQDIVSEQYVQHPWPPPSNKGRTQPKILMARIQGLFI